MRILTRCSACLTFLALTACPGGDAPYTHHVDGGADADADSAPGDGARPGADGEPGDAPPDESRPPPDPGSGARCGVNGRDDCGPFRLCDEALGCVDCARDDDCPLSARHCIAGSCVECRSFVTDGGVTVDDCPLAAPSCWPADHTCHPRCASAAACPADASACDLASGECRGCSVAADCAGGACSPITMQCVECVTDADCGGARPRCDPKRGVCDQCASNADCGHASPVCDPATRQCRVGCTSDAQCPGQRCDPPTAVCVAPPPDAGKDATLSD